MDRKEVGIAMDIGYMDIVEDSRLPWQKVSPKRTPPPPPLATSIPTPPLKIEKCID